MGSPLVLPGFRRRAHAILPAASQMRGHLQIYGRFLLHLLVRCGWELTWASDADAWPGFYLAPPPSRDPNDTLHRHRALRVQSAPSLLVGLQTRCWRGRLSTSHFTSMPEARVFSEGSGQRGFKDILIPGELLLSLNLTGNPQTPTGNHT